MRPDMFHLIVERPRLRFPRRAGSHDPRGTLRERFERELEDAPSRLGMGFPHAEKGLNENLAPLRRWLLAQAGRPWSRVRAEIRAVVDPRSATKLHVLQHVADLPADPDHRARCVDALVGDLGAEWFQSYEMKFQKTFGRLDAYATATREPGRRELARVRAMT